MQNPATTTSRQLLAVSQRMPSRWAIWIGCTAAVAEPTGGQGGAVELHSAFAVCQSTGANMWIFSTWAWKALEWNDREDWEVGGTAFAIYDSWNVKRTAPNRRHLQVLSTPLAAQLFLICHGHAAPLSPKRGWKGCLGLRIPPLVQPLVNQVNGLVKSTMIAAWSWFCTPTGAT